MHVAPVGDIERAIQSLGNFAEDGQHLRAGPEKELVGGKLHAVGIAERLSGLNAEQNFVGVGVFGTQVVAVVGGNQGNSRLPRQPNQIRIDLFVLLKPLVLNFDKEVSLAENLLQVIGRLLRPLVAVFEKRRGHLAAQASGKSNQAFRMLVQDVFVDPRFVIEAFPIGQRNKFHKIPVARLIFA